MNTVSAKLKMLIKAKAILEVLNAYKNSDGECELNTEEIAQLAYQKLLDWGIKNCKTTSLAQTFAILKKRGVVVSILHLEGVDKYIYENCGNVTYKAVMTYEEFAKKHIKARRRKRRRCTKNSNTQHQHHSELVFI